MRLGLSMLCGISKCHFLHPAHASSSRLLSTNFASPCALAVLEWFFFLLTLLLSSRAAFKRHHYYLRRTLASPFDLIVMPTSAVVDCCCQGLRKKEEGEEDEEEEESVKKLVRRMLFFVFFCSPFPPPLLLSFATELELRGTSNGVRRISHAARLGERHRVFIYSICSTVGTVGCQEGIEN